MPALFITATDTGVGKTTVAAGIASALAGMGRDVGVMKPFATGCRPKGGKLRSDDAELLAAAAGSRDPYELINPSAYRQPLAPYSAARVEGRKVDLSAVKRAYRELRRRHDFLIVEGIGGIAVPIAKGYVVADFVREMKLPAIIVARPSLGTLNHTLLTVEAAQRRKIDLLGIVINNAEGVRNDSAVRTNTRYWKEISSVPLLAIIPLIKGTQYLIHPVFADLCRGLLRRLHK